jgi:type II secretory pathway pseudopilin PulG
MVLVILALLGGSLLVPVASRIEARDRQTTLERLRDIQHALTGFAIIHGRLPCPSTETDPTSTAYGLEDGPPCNHTLEGVLPWRSLAVAATDAWGRDAPGRRATSGQGTGATALDPAYGRGTDRRSNRTQSPTCRSATTTAAGSPPSDSQAVAIVWSTGPNRRADGEQRQPFASAAPSYQAGEPGTDFDDLLAWIGRPLLVARLAQAGRL